MKLLKMTRLDVVRLLLEYGDNIERQDHHQFTPLLYSVWQEKLEACRLLLEFGANVHAWKNRRSVVLKNCELVELLLSYGAKPLPNTKKRWSCTYS